jgi:hypothetical protein
MPNTSNGKSISRMNAFKHGLRATDDLFLGYLNPDERERFETLRETYHTQYDPQTEPEKLIVDRIAIQHFRLYRLYGLENLAAHLSTDLLILGKGSKSKQRSLNESIIPHLDRFSRYDARIEKQLRVLHNRLHSLYVNRKYYGLNLYRNNE